MWGCIMSSGHYCDDCHQNYLHCTCGMTVGSISLSERLSGSYNVQEQEASERIKKLEDTLKSIIVFASVNTDRDVCLTIKCLAESGLEE